MIEEKPKEKVYLPDVIHCVLKVECKKCTYLRACIDKGKELITSDQRLIAKKAKRPA